MVSPRGEPRLVECRFDAVNMTGGMNTWASFGHPLITLPCNVTVEAADAGTRVAAVDPLGLMGDSAFAELSAEVSEKLRNAIAVIG